VPIVTAIFRQLDKLLFAAKLVHMVSRANLGRRFEAAAQTGVHLQ